MKLELFLALLDNLKCLTGPLLTIYIFVIIMATANYAVSYGRADEAQAKRILEKIKKFIPAAIILILVCVMPSVNDIWKVRIGLIKLELSSPENISKASDTIERIGKKLECRYLGCEKETK